MKNVLLAIIFVFSVSSYSSEHQVGVSYARINQDLEFKKPIKFEMDAIQLSYNYWLDSGLGFRLAVARSTETPNSIILDKKYTNKINALWKAHLTYKYEFNDDLSFIGGVGITEYHSTWWVDGKQPAWSEGIDSHKGSWFVGTQYRLFKNLLLELTYNYEYKKLKKGYGEEKTDSYSIGFTYNF